MTKIQIESKPLSATTAMEYRLGHPLENGVIPAPPLDWSIQHERYGDLFILLTGMLYS